MGVRCIRVSRRKWEGLKGEGVQGREGSEEEPKRNKKWEVYLEKWELISGEYE